MGIFSADEQPDRLAEETSLNRRAESFGLSPVDYLKQENKLQVARIRELLVENDRHRIECERLQAEINRLRRNHDTNKS